ncbi:hypothetical protein EI94DRAFT_1817719 [Lactarius quietus]|nr:hypothetical protein EI94DRAFT_1817719 [Lactarius quietus]
MPSQPNLPLRDSFGRFIRRLPTIPDETPPTSRASSPSANPLDSPVSNTTARPGLALPSPAAHHLPGLFPSSEDSVSFSRLVAAAADNLASSSSSPLSLPTGSFSSASPSAASPFSSHDNSSDVSFPDPALEPLPDSDDSDSPDSKLDSSLSYHSTIASSSTIVPPRTSESQFLPQKEVSPAYLPVVNDPQPPASDSAQEPLLFPVSVLPILPRLHLVSPPLHSLLPSRPAAMPAPRSNKALFFGDQSGESLEVFLWEYENLALTHGLTVMVVATQA